MTAAMTPSSATGMAAGMATAVARLCCARTRPPGEARVGVVTEASGCANQGDRQYHYAAYANNSFRFCVHDRCLRA